MRKKNARKLKEELEGINRAFILMARYGRANLFRDLNKRAKEIEKKLKETQCKR